ncbi:MAG: DsrE family protein [Rhodanobacter sp.]|jgi:intracellular sulfur oxidation DsrE/DsrF family protein|nr:DsrE family protein [Rhodanobacter sp.]
MNIKLAGISALACMALVAISLPLQAADHAKAAAKATPEVTWVYPVIPKFGGVHPRPDVDVQPDPNANYKVFVDVVSAPRDMGKPMGSLKRLARLVNLMGYAKVPPGHVHIVALLDGDAELAGVINARYREHFKKDNPNLEILHALKKAGVKLMICSQALAGAGLKDSDVDPSVTITLSAVMDPVVYGQRGYTFMQL